jgi:hypothetical protein
MKAVTKKAYARIDPAHIADGLFVPLKGVSRKNLKLDVQTEFGGSKLHFMGFEPLGGNDQSMLLAVAAQTGVDGLAVSPDTTAPISSQLRLGLMIKGDALDKSNGIVKTSLYSLMLDAGMNPDDGRAIHEAKECLRRMSNVTVWIDNPDGWSGSSNLLNVTYHKDGRTYVMINWRLAGSVIFRDQHIKVSLFERNKLESEAAKILHCWLCSNMRLGQAIGNGSGAKLDTLLPHVWGTQVEQWSAKRKSQKRGMLHEALEEIRDRLEQLHQGNGWIVNITGSGLVLLSRPRELPHHEKECGFTHHD